MKAVWWEAAAVRPTLVGGKGSESDMFGRFGRRRGKLQVAKAGRLGGRRVRGHCGRFEAVDGDSVMVGANLKAEGQRKTV